MKRYMIILFFILSIAACQLDPFAQVTPTATPHPTITATATSEHVRECIVSADALNMRTGPGTSYAVIGWLYAGDVVIVQTQRGAWLNIGAGWVHSKYCEEQ